MKTISRQTFSKEERLSSKKIIEALNKDGRSLKAFPFRMAWLVTELPSKFPAQIMMAVPKKNFPRALDRNRIKRHMREVYRKNKELIYSQLRNKGKQIALMLVYLDKTPAEYAEMEKKIILTLQRLTLDLDKHQGK